MFELPPRPNIDQFKDVEWVIETGEQDITLGIYEIWKDQWEDKFELEFAASSRIRKYTTLKGKMIPLTAKCNFVKVNEYIICLLQPSSRCVSHNKMKEAILTFCQIPDSCFTNDLNSHTVMNQIFDHKVKPKLSYEDENKTLFEKTDFVITVGGDFNLDCLEKDWDKYREEKKFSWVKFSAPVEFGYSTISPEEEHICKAILKVALINNTLVGFIQNLGLFGDHKKLKAKIPEWCPNATHVLYSKHAPFLLERLSNL